MEYLRAYMERTDQEEGPLRFVASTEGIKRDGKDLKAANWMLDNFRKNPVVLWVHGYAAGIPPIGRAVNIEAAGGKLITEIEFDKEDEFARQVESKYRRGFLNAVSVGWADVQAKDATKYDLLDISAVPVPADPQALIERERIAMRALGEEMLRVAGKIDTKNLTTIVTERRGATPPHSTPKMPEETDWDGPSEVAKAEGREQLRRMHAWVDEEQDPDLKQAYKLPHHLTSGQVVWRGVAAAMARLLQAGTQIPDADREGVYRHLRRHYEQFDKEAPEFRTLQELEALDEEAVRGLFLEGEGEMWPRLFDGARVGAVLSARNKAALEEAVTLITGVLDAASKKPEEEEREGDLQTLTGIKERLAQFPTGGN